MIVDTSAIMAILRHEPERSAFTNAIFQSTHVVMSAASFVELTAVITRGHPNLEPAAEALLQAAGITLEAVSVVQAELAAAAYRRYGKGSGHPAALNFGDCFSYALAKSTGEPLLFKGDDFRRTDVGRWDG